MNTPNPTPAPDMAVETVLRLALDALEPFQRDAEGIHKDWSDERRRASLTQDRPITVGDYRKAHAAHAALRAALARPQEVAGAVWVPVSERLPERLPGEDVSREVLIFGGNGLRLCRVSYEHQHKDYDYGHAKVPVFENADATHWADVTLPAASRAPVAVGVEPTQPLPLETAPKDGTIVRLLVEFEEHQLEDREGPQWTIGANSGDNTGEDAWEFAGWSWEQDCFWNGVGKPIAWLPFDTPSAGAGGSVGAEPAHEFWELLHEWRDTVNTERADWIEHRFSELLRLATPAPSVPLGGGEGVVNAAIDAAIYSLRDAGFRVHRAAVIAAIEAFTKSMEVK